MVDRLEVYLRVPLEVNELNKQALQSGILNFDQPQNWQRYFYGVIKTFPWLVYSFWGTPEGEFYGARRLPQNEL